MASDITIPSGSGNLGTWLYQDKEFPFFATKYRLNEITQTHPRDSDIFIATYPKSGTTWVQTIVHLLLRKKPIESALDWLQPFLELPIVKSNEEGNKLPIAPFFYTEEFIEKLPIPRVFKTHLPWEIVPKNSNAKYIYTYRNPKDIVVSGYHYVKGLKYYSYHGTIDEYISLFKLGKVEYGDWRDHVNSWYNNKHLPNILLLTYEDLSKNFKSSVLRVAAFLSIELTNQLYEFVSDFSSFQSMKSNKFVNKSDVPWNKNTDAFIRNGTVGDWKNYFSDEQCVSFNSWCDEKVNYDINLYYSMKSI